MQSKQDAATVVREWMEDEELGFCPHDALESVLDELDQWRGLGEKIEECDTEFDTIRKCEDGRYRYNWSHTKDANGIRYHFEGSNTLLGEWLKLKQGAK